MFSNTLKGDGRKMDRKMLTALLVVLVASGFAACHWMMQNPQSDPSPELPPALPPPEVRTVVGAEQLNQPWGVFGGSDGPIYIADTFNARVLTLCLDDEVPTLAWEFQPFSLPFGGVVDSEERILIADNDNRIWVVDGETVSAFAGNGNPGHADGSLAEALFSFPSGIAMDDGGNLYIADAGNHVVRRISPDGAVTTIAGQPGQLGFADGPAEDALFREPQGIAVSPDGKMVYIADTGNHLIRIIENGSVRTLAGRLVLDEDGIPQGSFDDTRLSPLSFPVGLALVCEVLIVADAGNHRVRAVWPWGEIVNLAGSGRPDYTDGYADQAAFNWPTGVYYRDGELFIADAGNNAIRAMPLELDTPG